MLELTIETKLGRLRKGRSFRGVVLAYATAPGLWGASSGVLRPVYLAVAASDDEARSLLENLRAGERASLTGDHLGKTSAPLELMRSANYAFPVQRTPEGTIVTAYLPSVFDFHPGLLDPDAVRFALLPAREDFEAVPVPTDDLATVWRHLSALEDAAESNVSRDLCAMAAMWAAYLDQRSELPIPPDLDFRVQLFVAALREGLASRPLPLSRSANLSPDQHRMLDFHVYLAEGFPLVPGVACMATHKALAAFLAEEIQRYEQARAKASRRRRLTAAELEMFKTSKKEAA